MTYTVTSENAAGDVAKLITITLPNGNKQMFEVCKDGKAFYAGSNTMAPNFSEGLEKVKAMGAKIEIEVI